MSRFQGQASPLQDMTQEVLAGGYPEMRQRSTPARRQAWARELIGIEVKAAASVQASDFKGLRRLREVAGKPFVTGIVIYGGQQALSFGDGFWAVPLNQL